MSQGSTPVARRAPSAWNVANGLTVLGAVAQAGGYTYRAKTGEGLIKRAGQDAERDARAAGADLFLTKPFSPLDLLRLVDEIGAAG